MSAGYDLKEYPWGFGRTFFAIDPISKKVLWVQDEPNRIDSRGVCMKGGRIYCYSEQKYLACLDAQTGKPVWRASDEELLKTIGPTQRAQNWGTGMSTFGYMMCSDQAVYFIGPHRLSLVAVSTEDGSLLWHHPFGNYRPILRQEGLYAMAPPRTTENTLLFDPLTGKILAQMDFRRSACTRPTGSYDSIFCRAHNNWGTSRLTVADQKFRRIAPMRPPCHDGVITTAGLVHWGAWICDCGVSMIGNITLAPAGDFDFAAEATEDERLESGVMLTDTPVAAVLRGSAEAWPGDWPTFRADNQRSAFSPVDIPEKVSQIWQYQPPGTTTPAALITYRQMVFTSGSDGAIRAIRAADGRLEWTAYTGGPIVYPPAIEQGRLLAGSGDGWIYCFDAGTGGRLWRFRAAPSAERIPIYGQLASRWPIGSGVLVDRGVVYAAAGIASYDGTHVFALDAATGRIRWQNHTSGHLPPDSVIGVSVQGHLLLHEDKLYMPGGNVVSPAVYDIRDGRCLNVIEDEWKADATPRGRDLFVIAGKVVCFDRRLYGPQRYWPGRRYLGPLTRAQNGETVICDVGGRVARIVPETVVPNAGQKSQKLQVLWKSNHLEATEALALGNNAVVVAGRLPSLENSTEPAYALAAFEVNDGTLLWSHSLPAMPASWGLALNNAGQIVVTLANGHVMCYGRQP
jgi:outer membrane protein assembly factor BamB